jgi:hypothetical protein
MAEERNGEARLEQRTGVQCMAETWAWRGKERQERNSEQWTGKQRTGRARTGAVRLVALVWTGQARNAMERNRTEWPHRIGEERPGRDGLGWAAVDYRGKDCIGTARPGAQRQER